MHFEKIVDSDTVWTYQVSSVRLFCKSDKDSKIVLVNYHDYNVIIEKELSNFFQLPTLTTNNIKSSLNKIRKTAEGKIIKLHKHGAISDDLLEHTVGIKLYDHTKYKRFPVL